MLFLLGSSRSRRRSATVTSSTSAASRAATISSMVRYLPVPRINRERSVSRATTTESSISASSLSCSSRIIECPRRGCQQWAGLGPPEEQGDGAGGFQDAQGAYRHYVDEAADEAGANQRRGLADPLIDVQMRAQRSNHYQGCDGEQEGSQRSSCQEWEESAWLGPA